jgi:hypothetical protein
MELDDIGQRRRSRFRGWSCLSSLVGRVLPEGNLRDVEPLRYIESLIACLLGRVDSRNILVAADDATEHL